MSDTAPRIVHVSVPISVWDLDGITTDELVEWAVAIRDAVPEQFRSEAKIEFDPGDGGAYLSLGYHRIELDSERQKRERDARERAAEEATREYELYERLKAKFG